MLSANDIEQNLGIQLTSAQKNYFENRQLNKYVLPSSNLQISTLLTKFNKPQVYFRLCTLICKFKQTYDFPKFTYFLLKNKYAKDIEIYENIFKDIPKIVSVTEYSKEYVAEYIVNILNSLKLKPTSLLDIGCGNCIITRDLGFALNMKPQDIYGADIPQEFEQKWKETRPKEIKFIEIKDNKLKFDRTFDMITCMMVLHHVPENVLEEYISEIYKLLNKGGVFILKEHDCFNAVDYIIADIEHSLYIAKEEFASNKNRKLSEKVIKNILDQKMVYKDRFTWKVLIQKVGFKCIYENPFDKTLSNTYSGDRAYLAVFLKN
jgi:2-polyprenyl-3-methyl-5-hydroxy-6-metoxy-1,4-benzoquinol methylase